MHVFLDATSCTPCTSFLRPIVPGNRDGRQVLGPLANAVQFVLDVILKQLLKVRQGRLRVGVVHDVVVVTCFR